MGVHEFDPYGNKTENTILAGAGVLILGILLFMLWIIS